MSGENVDKIRRAYDAYSRGDFDTAVEGVHPEVEFVRPGGQAPVTGARAFRAWMEPDAFEDVRLEPLEFHTNGNKVLVRQFNRARGAGSGIDLEGEVWAVWTFDESGLVTRLEGFLGHQRNEALEAAGLSDRPQ
jgi:ketosteroid isomerase-like protein